MTYKFEGPQNAQHLGNAYMTYKFEGPFESAFTGKPTIPAGHTTDATKNAQHCERLLNAAADYIAATLVQPADKRAWIALLTYAPTDILLERLVAKFNLDGIDADSLTVGEIRRAI